MHYRSALESKSILITGATGLIGSNILRVLPSSAKVSTAPFPFEKFDYIIHAAGYAAPARFLTVPLETVSVNTTKLMYLLDQLAPGGRLLFLSTSEVYSGCTRAVYREEDIGTTTPAHPRAVYIESKRCGEAICHAANAAGKTALIARVSLAYGPGCRPNDPRVMSEFIDSALRDRHIEVRDGGAAQRTYCYIDDIVDMLLNILAFGKMPLYNVGGISQISIHGLAKRIAELTRAQVRIPRNSPQASPGAPPHVRLDMSRYVREFGERDYVDLDEGLRRTIAWHEQLMAGVAA